MKKTIVITALIFIVGCGGDPENNHTGENFNEAGHKQLSIKKVDEFHLHSEEIQIGRIETPVLFHEDNILFYDPGLHQIIISNTEGAIFSAFGRSGEGPKEFRHISSFGVDRDTVIVYDASLDLVKKFTKDGELLEIYDGLLKDKLWIRSKILYEYENQYVFGIQEAGRSGHNDHWLSNIIAVYDKSGELVRMMGEYDPSLEGSHRMYNFSYMSVDSKEGVVYTVHRTSPFIQKFDIRTGEKMSRFGQPTANFRISDEYPSETAPREVRNRINLNRSAVGHPFISNDYFAFYFFNFTEEFWDGRGQNDKVNYLQIFDKEDMYVGEIALPYFPLGLDQNSRLYLLEDEDPDNALIGVYEILEADTENSYSNTNSKMNR